MVLTPPYLNQLGSASYEICHQCAYEFGYDDDPWDGEPGPTFEEYRRTWILSGRPWFADRDRPPGRASTGEITTPQLQLPPGPSDAPPAEPKTTDQ
jgi:hypothetical protein